MRLVVFLLAAALLVGCDSESTAPTPADPIDGMWAGTLTATRCPGGRLTCHRDTLDVVLWVSGLSGSLCLDGVGADSARVQSRTKTTFIFVGWFGESEVHLQGHAEGDRLIGASGSVGDGLRDGVFDLYRLR